MHYINEGKAIHKQVRLGKQRPIQKQKNAPDKPYRPPRNNSVRTYKRREEMGPRDEMIFARFNGVDKGFGVSSLDEVKLNRHSGKTTKKEINGKMVNGRKLNGTFIQMSEDIKKCPPGQSKEFRKWWNYVVKTGHLKSGSDSMILFNYVRTLVAWNATWKGIDATGGVVVPYKRGDGMKANPLMVLEDKLSKRLISLGAKLGLSPYDGQRIFQLPEDEDSSEMDKLLGHTE